MPSQSPPQIPYRPAPGRAARSLRRAHRLTAFALAGFLLLHLANHAALIWGIDAHARTLAALRPIYRAPLVEPALIVLIVLQMGLGLRLLWRRRIARTGWPLWQIVSGGYLVFFLVQHLGAIFLARLNGTDTTTAFAAGVVNAMPQALYFAPYYVLAIAALFTHLAATLAFTRAARRLHPVLPVLPVFGLMFGIVIVAGLRGAFG